MAGPNQAGLCMDAVVLDGVTKRFDSLTAVAGLNLRIRQGSFFGLLGPNGAGKTTTLRMILRILLPDEGSIQILGQPLGETTQDRLGYLPEERGLYPRMTVQAVLVFLGALKGLDEAEAGRRAAGWLERLEIGDWGPRKVNELSKGMQQKVQFIAAILHEPPVLVLDEPFMGLDPVNAGVVKDIMLELRDHGATIVLSTHRMEQVEMMCDSICLIDRGRQVLSGDLREIKRAYGRNTVRIEYAAGRDSFDLDRFAASVNRFGSTVEAKLRPDVEPGEILKAIVEQGVSIVRFELIEPPLADIFIEKVTGNHA
ncbi:MAG TPA: ATP-binding cassette domain-containing protein [Candidatus Acidoferrales bacterium]|nr:ATP-binding cassette domain-containing protein [Candidatus Acidoferrales bacterium]